MRILLVLNGILAVVFAYWFVQGAFIYNPVTDAKVAYDQTLLFRGFFALVFFMQWLTLTVVLKHMGKTS